MTMTMKTFYLDTEKNSKMLNIVDIIIMLIMLVIDILVCPEILLVYYDAASTRPPNYLNYFKWEILCHFTNSAELQCVLYYSINNI